MNQQILDRIKQSMNKLHDDILERYFINLSQSSDFQDIITQLQMLRESESDISSDEDYHKSMKRELQLQLKNIEANKQQLQEIEQQNKLIAQLTDRNIYDQPFSITPDVDQLFQFKQDLEEQMIMNEKNAQKIQAKMKENHKMIKRLLKNIQQKNQKLQLLYDSNSSFDRCANQSIDRLDDDIQGLTQQIQRLIK